VVVVIVVVVVVVVVAAAVVVVVVPVSMSLRSPCSFPVRAVVGLMGQ